jgi:hypothetical protein
MFFRRRKRLNDASKKGITLVMNFWLINPFANFWSTDPLTSRGRFISRRFDHFILLLAIFAPIIAILSLIASFSFSNFLPLLFIDAIAIVAMCYVYRIWDNRPIRIECGRCDSIIFSNVPWVCGFCKKINNDWLQYPFVAECAYCGNEPKVYRCHHKDCGEPIFLSEDQSVTNIASHSLSEIPQPEIDKRFSKRQEHADRKEDKENEIAMAELDQKLKSIRQRSKNPKTPYNEHEQKYEKVYGDLMGAKKYFHKKRIEIDEEFKNEPEMRKAAHEAVDEAERRFT